MEIKEIKNIKESIGTVIPSSEHGNVKVIGFEEIKGWDNKVIIYLDRANKDNVIGSFNNSGYLPGGAMIVEKTNEEVSFPN